MATELTAVDYLTRSVDRNRYRASGERFAVIDEGSERTVSFDDWRSESGYDDGSELF